MFLNNSAKEALIGISNWYDEVNEKGGISIDDLARLKMFVDLSRQILDTDKELQDAEPMQQSLPFADSFLGEDDIPF